ncbi:MAG: tRNA-binding protein [Desulfovibrio sp.]|jgi:tRNA-binding protein|nr:tRNA-binding protein [Desulfovibrio sp.]
MDTVTFSDFVKLDIRAGVVLSAELNQKARKPAYILQIDFGPEIGVKHSSGQFVDCYTAEGMVGRTILGVVNFPPRKIADCLSEVLVLGVYAKQGVVLLQPEQGVEKGDKVG